MTMKKILTGVLSILVMTGLVFALSGCFGIPKGTQESANVGKLHLLIKGAGIVKADTEKTTFRIRCHRCGFVTEEFTVDTTAVGKPYILNWVCPKCQNKQTIVIEATGL